MTPELLAKSREAMPDRVVSLVADALFSTGEFDPSTLSAEDVSELLHELIVRRSAPLPSPDLQGLREAMELWLLDKIAEARQNGVKAAGDSSSPIWFAEANAYQRVLDRLSKAALLSTSSTVQGGWSYDLEAAPQDSRVWISYTITGEEGQTLAVLSQGTTWVYEGQRFWDLLGGITCRTVYAWKPFEKPSTAAPLPVSDKGGAQ